MIIEFTVENFRSIKEAQTLSMIADSGRKKSDNVFEVDGMRLLKSAVIYGPNASGKTNVIRALHSFQDLVKNSFRFARNESITQYNPFFLCKKSQQQATHFILDFLDTNFIKHTYEFAFNRKEIIIEKLTYYPKGFQTTEELLFVRENKEITLGNSFEDKTVNTQILPNRLFLSEIGGNTANEQLGNIYSYIQKISVWNDLDDINLDMLTKVTAKRFSITETKEWQKQLRKLIKIADVKIENLVIREIDETFYKFPDNFQEEHKKALIEQNRFQVQMLHSVYNSQENTNELVGFDIREESKGTQVLFALGGLIIFSLYQNRTVIFDEFDNSLHPKLSKFLISLFHKPNLNKQNTQLIFATHDTSLLDKKLFRKDQIWITEKNKYGETELFSIQDIEGIRDDVPFEKWYMEGKFGGQPKIKELEFIFGDE